jgi:two-component system response regulator LytT
MKKFSCIAIDDEPLALLVITQFCERFGNLDLSTFSEPRIGLEEIKRHKPDLVFLDIEMNSINGLDIAHALPRECCFIFTTAHAQYALNGFDLDAVDFLHKPFAYERFKKAVEKAIRRIETEKVPENIVIKQEYANVTIPINDILYIEAMENYTKIFRENGGYILSRTNMNDSRNFARRKFSPHSPFIYRTYRKNRNVFQEKNKTYWERNISPHRKTLR